MRHAERRVVLESRAQGSSFELHVTDDAPGFPVDFLPRAWERFTRAETGRTKDGVGLRLAIVRAIAEAHGGQAGAANRPGGGADVWLTLPVHGEPASA